MHALAATCVLELAFFAAMPVWLDRGAAGMRLNAVTTLIEDPEQRDESVAASVGRVE